MKYLIAMSMMLCGSAWALPSNCTVGTNVYYVSQAGSDANSQTQSKSKSTPWKHAPYQNSFTGTYSHTAGDCFVFHGNDTWNVGTTDYFVVSNGGASGNADYYGVDPTWFSGGSWNRPIFDVQSSFPNTDAFHSATVFLMSAAWVTFDNFEIINAACVATPTQTNLNLFATAGHNGIVVTNSYFHQFKAQLNGCGSGVVTGGNSSGNSFAIWVYMSVNADGGNGSFDHNVVDGTDGTGEKGYDTIVMDPGTSATAGYNVLHDICSGIAGLMNLIHDNLIYNFGKNSNPTGWDCVNEGVHAHAIRAQADATVYNNVIHDTNDGIIKTNPTSGSMFYIFNNVSYSNGYPGFAWNQIELCDNGGGACASGKVTVFNNTLQCVENSGASSVCFRLDDVMNTLIIKNEHHVGLDATGSLTGTSNATTYTATNNVFQQQGTCAGCADANSSPHFDRYTLSQNPILSPVASANSTVGAGATVPGGAPAAANSSTTYACSQVTISGVVQVSCPLQAPNLRSVSPDAGAYQFAATVSFSASPATLPANHSNNIAVALAGVGTAWNGSTAFSISGVSGATLVSSSNTSATSETLQITTGTGTGTLTIADTTDSISTTIAVATATLALAPTVGNVSTTPTLTLTGTNTLWTTETASTLLSVSGGGCSGESIATPTVTSNTAATAVLTTGSAACSITVTDNSTTASATFTVRNVAIAPATIPAHHSGHISLALTGSGTSWTGSTTFSASGVAGASVFSQTNTSGTLETVVVTTGSGTGTLTLTGSDGSSGTVIVATATLAVSPSSGFTGTTPAVTLTGTNTLWSSETPSTLFTVTGVGCSGESLGVPSVSSNTAATDNLTTGSLACTETITDNSTTATTTFTVTSAGNFIIGPGSAIIAFNPTQTDSNSGGRK